MKVATWILVGALASLTFAVGCSSSDTGSGATGGTGGGATGGTGGGATGGTAGAATGGSAGSATGGSAGSGAFWDGAYDSAALPTPASGNHNAGMNCHNCHTGGGAPQWEFGGTVYDASGSGVSHVQIGVRDKDGLLTTYSAENGNFWLPATSPPIDWTTAEIRTRNANGEKIMPTGNSAQAGCNSCHIAGNKILAP